MEHLAEVCGAFKLYPGPYGTTGGRAAMNTLAWLVVIAVSAFVWWNVRGRPTLIAIFAALFLMQCNADIERARYSAAITLLCRAALAQPAEAR
jgi:hypothetical protein